jgi:hypothetical protein
LVTPGIAFCSINSVGMPRSAANSTTGPELYPPTPITIDGRRRESTRHASMALIGSNPTPRASDATDLPFSPAL